MIRELPTPDDLPPALLGQDAFATLAWYRSTIAAALPTGSKAAFQVVERAGVVEAAFPMLRRGRGLAALATPYTCLWHPLLTPGLSARRLGEIGQELAPSWRRAGVVRLEAMAPDPAMDAVLDGLRGAGLRTLRFDHFGNWHVGVAGVGWDAYLAARPGALRTTIGRASKRLMQGRGAAFTLVRDADGLEAGIAAYETVYAASWKEAEPCPDFNATLMRACAADGSLRLGIITLDGAPVAVQFWLVHDWWAGVLKLAHDEAQRALAPGTVLSALMIRHLLDVDGVRELDFGRGDDGYKRLWTGARRQLLGVLVVDPLSLAGMFEMARHVAGWVAREGRPSFLKKRSKKLFSVLSRTPLIKVFWSFFSKKDYFLSTPR